MHEGFWSYIDFNNTVDLLVVPTHLALMYATYMNKYQINITAINRYYGLDEITPLECTDSDTPCID